MTGVHGILLGRVASSSAEKRGMPERAGEAGPIPDHAELLSAEKRGMPERAGEAGPIPDHAELFLRGVTAGAASLSSGEDAAWRLNGRFNRVTTGVSQ